MNHHDMDDLDRALAALPLDEPPAGLHARIMALTVYRPRPVVRTWEFWVVGTLAALAIWFSWTVLSAPHAGERLVEGMTRLLDRVGFTSVTTVLWVAIGASAALWISQLTFPAARRIRIE